MKKPHVIFFIAFLGLLAATVSLSNAASSPIQFGNLDLCVVSSGWAYEEVYITKGNISPDFDSLIPMKVVEDQIETRLALVRIWSTETQTVQIVFSSDDQGSFTKEFDFSLGSYNIVMSFIETPPFPFVTDYATLTIQKLIDGFWWDQLEVRIDTDSWGQAHFITKSTGVDGILQREQRNLSHTETSQISIPNGVVYLDGDELFPYNRVCSGPPPYVVCSTITRKITFGDYGETSIVADPFGRTKTVRITPFDEFVLYDTFQNLQITHRRLQDIDHDGIPDVDDNCPNEPNSTQEDLDNDTIGDVCDDDVDGDGVLNADDVFPLDPSRWMHDITPMLELLLLRPIPLKGDLDGDGNIDMDDINLVMSLISSGSYDPNADINGDEVINVLDARQLVLKCTNPNCVP